MTQEGERFLQAEQSAQDVLNALSKLKEEAVSYKNGTKELATARESLVKLIDSILAIAKDTHEIVKLIKAIGGPEILRSIDSVSKRLHEEADKNLHRFEHREIICAVS